MHQTRAHVNELLEAKILEAAAQAQAEREILQASLASREAELANLQELLQVCKGMNAKVVYWLLWVSSSVKPDDDFRTQNLWHPIPKYRSQVGL